MKNKRKRLFKAIISYLLCIAMIAPNVTPIVTYGAEYLANVPRYVNFVRPEALSLTDVGLGTPSDSEQEESEIESETDSGSTSDSSSSEKPVIEARPSVDGKASPSDADIREPEDFYDGGEEEPGGRLVQFDEKRNIRTYEQTEGEYITVVGGYSGLYRDENNFIRSVDNTLIHTDRKSNNDSEFDEDLEEDSWDIELTNDIGASPSNQRSAKKIRIASGSNAYYNEAGNIDVYLPERMNSRTGYKISDGEDSIEIIPQEGNYSKHITRDNIIRYNDVFKDIDVQYTVLGNTVKEDIILLEKQDKNEFTYKLKSSTLKFRKDGDAVVAYESSYKNPKFAVTAPVMIDADGNTSTDIKLKYNSSDKTVTYTADKDWLEDSERAYPVRLDPTGAVLVDYTAFQINMVAKGGAHVAKPDAGNLYFGVNTNPMAGYSEHWGYCRTMIYIDTAWESLIGHPETETDGPAVKNVQLSLTTMSKDAVDRTAFEAFIPSKEWNPAAITWNNMKKDGVDANMKATGEIQYSAGSGERMVFDITESYYNWLDKPETRTGLLIQAAVEGGDDTYVPGSGETDKVSWAETFYNQNGGAKFGPRLEVAWNGELENVDLMTLDMSKFSIEVNPGVVESDAGGRNTKGILAHGASQAYASVDYRIKEKVGNDVVADGTVEAHDEVDCPDYEQVDEECIWAEYQDSNWQSDPVLAFNPLEMDTIYYAEAMGTGKEVIEDEEGNPALGEEEVVTDWKKSDEFLLYLVQASDILPRIARHYGVSTNTLMEDNMLGFQLAQAGDVIFIRKPGIEKPYTPSLTPDQMEDFIKNCLLNGLDPRCEVGGEPVNLSTGSFYMSQEDASFDELDDKFSITRSYNGLTPYFRSEFGMGWNSIIGERIMVLPDGSILYTSNDGKGLVFTKEGEDTYKAPDGYDYELKPVDTIEIVTGTNEEKEQPEAEDGEATEEVTEQSRMLTTENVVAGDSAENPEEEGEIEPVEPATGWEISKPDGTVRVFNSYGLLVM